MTGGQRRPVLAVQRGLFGVAVLFLGVLGAGILCWAFPLVEFGPHVSLLSDAASWSGLCLQRC